MFAVGIVSCGLFPEPRPAHSEILTGPDGLRTFTVVHELDGVPMACPAFGLVDPLVGTLAGDPNGPGEPVWLEGVDHQRLSVIWPEGFTVRFEPMAVLYDEAGNVVSRAGQSTELDQVRADAHAGTFEDPFVASGILFNGCYSFVK
jgi:hypothetical protein